MAMDDERAMLLLDEEHEDAVHVKDGITVVAVAADVQMDAADDLGGIP